MNFLQQHGPVGLLHYPHPADVLITSSDDILTEDPQPKQWLKTQEMTDASNALAKTI